MPLRCPARLEVPAAAAAAAVAAAAGGHQGEQPSSMNAQVKIGRLARTDI